MRGIHCCRAIMLGTALPVGGHALVQACPTKAIRLVAPFPSGGTSEVTASVKIDSGRIGKALRDASVQPE